MVTLNSNVVTAPGVYVSENTAGLIPAGLASFNRCYMLGTGSTGPYNEPTQVITKTDFENQFGATGSAESVGLFFANAPQGLLKFIRVGAPGKAQLLLGSAAAGAFSVTLDGTAITYTATSGQTQAQIAAGLANAINTSAVAADIKAIAGTDKVNLETTAIEDTFTLTSPTAPGGSSLTPRYWQYQITAGTGGNGAWTLVINETTVTYTASGSPPLAAIVTGLAAAVAANATVNAIATVDSITGTGFILKPKSADTLLSVTGATAPAGGTLTATPTVIVPTIGAYIHAIQNAFDPEQDAQGFMIAPDGFESLAAQGDRLALATAMENQCSTEGFDWMALVDAGSTTAIANVSQANTEGKLYTTARGHLAYFYPYLKDLENREVPPSAAVAAIALRRYADQGFQQPPGGGQYPVRGVLDVVQRITKQEQAVSNPDGINLIRYFPNQGVLIYGARTRSSNPYYRFINTRIILNVLIGTLRTAFNSLVFSAVDGQGVLFTRIRETANAICYRLWRGQALYGATAGEAFVCKCDGTNNPDLDLEDGVVRLDVYVAPVPTMERLLINVVRTAIGQVQVTAQDLG